MATTNTYEFQKLSADNIDLLKPLYKAVFNVDHSLETLKAKYQPSYTGIIAQGHFAFHKGKAVAFHGAIPMIATQGGKKELCAQYGDAMTRKEHAGNGLFTKLGLLTDEELKNKGVCFVWGFPNQNSEYGYVNKLAWQGTERMKGFIIPISKISAETVFRKTKVFEKFGDDRIAKRLAPMLAPKQSLHSIDVNLHGGIDRSNEYYHYKYFTTNYFVSLPNGRAWIKPKGGLLVGDMECSSQVQVERLVQELIDLAKILGLNKVVIQASPKSQLAVFLSSKYTSTDTWLIGYKSFNSEFDLGRLQFTYGDLDTF